MFVAKNKKEDVFFIVSKVGKDNTKANFYDKKGEAVSKKYIKVKYRDSITGHFVVGEYASKNKSLKIIERIPKPGNGDSKNRTGLRRSLFVGRSSGTGKFALTDEAKRHSDFTVERIPKDSPVYFEKYKGK